MARTKVLKDGEGVAVPNKKVWRFTCCDCGLTHDVFLVADKPHVKVIGLAMKRNKRSTSARRKK